MRFLNLLLSLLCFVSSLKAQPFDLSGGGMVVFDPDSGDVVKKSGNELAQKLSAITDTVFLAVDEAVSPSIRLRRSPETVGALAKDDYEIISSAEGGISITGSSDAAIRHAVWDLLHRIGYRQYFPGGTWEIIPQRKDLQLDISVKESPAYASRRIWYGGGIWKENREAYFDWVAKNRMEGSFTLNTGHASYRLIQSQRATFDAHPEFYALVDGERKISDTTKMCISNPGVIAAAKQYGLDFFAKNPDSDSVSVDPSDGGGWCECEDCAALGSPSDRAVTLANAVADAVTEEVGEDKYVGMYAYNYHSQPPSIAVHPNVIISAATAFIKGGRKVEDIISDWSAKGATIGIREYYSVNTWDRDLPGAARGSDLEYLADTIPGFHGMGARFLSAESSENWGPNGFGYYFASRLMWDPEEAGKRQEIQEEFLRNCFGAASDPMRDFYHLIDKSNKQARLVFGDQLARMFDALGRGRKLAGDDPRVLRRIDDLILYTRHAELYDIYRRSAVPDRQKAYEAMIRHAYRIRDTMMVHSLGLYRDVDRRDKAITVPGEAGWRVPEEENPWKNSERYPDGEIVEFLKDGLVNHEKIELDFTAREFDENNLVMASEILTLPELTAGGAEVGRGKRSWLTVVNEAPASLELNITGGMIEHYRDRGNIRVSLSKMGGASATGEEMTLVAEDTSVPPDGVEKSVQLAIPEAGVYRIDLDDGHDMTRVRWPEGQAMSWKMSMDEFPARFTGRWTLYFYVPVDTKTIGLYSAASAGKLLDPDGSIAIDLKKDGGGFFSVPVPEGMGGRLWKVSQAAGSVRLLNVPPFMARSPGELVLPRDADTSG